MNNPFESYDKFFSSIFPGQSPFDYQRRLAEDDVLPSLVNVPTGAGKTNAILGAWLWRRLTNPQSAGRRLIYCLPMRTLVEQTRDVAKNAIGNLKKELPERFKDLNHFVLMGGDITEEWDSWPERECILIGTQDMLLSRALNRGYAMSRFRWPVHFGLLNNDCCWIFDEIQLMSDGLATTAQLAAFRERFETFGHSESVWMSATLDRNWLRQIDFAPKVDQLKQLEISDQDKISEVLSNRLNAVKHLRQAPQICRLPSGLAGFVKEKHIPGNQTLIVVNTVNRAREVYDELIEKFGKSVAKGKKRPTATDVESPADSSPEIVLIHSRFRPAERALWSTLFSQNIDIQSAGRIIVATQVIEAGVDISSSLLITDLAPFSSLVQRFGRCNRKGEFESAEIYWVDRPLTEKTAKLDVPESLEDEDMKKIAQPYEWRDLKEAQEQLEGLQSASPCVLTEVHYRAPYTPAHVLRRRDLVDLFDTTPDLSGYDLDVSRFVRGGEERDVSVAWRELNSAKPQISEPRPQRDELCSVPIHEIKDFLKGKEKRAWAWDALDGDWRKVTAEELRPGLTLLLDVEAGGYDDLRGWDSKSKSTVGVVKHVTRENEAFDDDRLTLRLKYEQTLAAHSLEARRKAELIMDKIRLTELEEFRAELLDATQHHDWGKAHRIFQATLHGIPKEASIEDLALDPLLAKSKSGQRHRRKHFRHELASALALLQTGASDLIVYLAACHHGKVRLSIRAMPDETRPNEATTRFARGIWDGDELPEADLGNGVHTVKLTLDLEPMLLGRSNNDHPSWLERMLALRDRLGIFRLAYLECLIRAADVQASSEPQEVLPTAEERK
ncbi:MAG: CRISPR-associated helicase Cas3' [Acidobacteriota bacterium]|nr:MAG: CRISPR-associated helicase Cas3' [Acidobacteriota bacterium]